jgi:hypothetical protein
MIMMQSRMVARTGAQHGFARQLRRATLGGFVSLAVLAVLAPGAARAQEEEKSGVWDSITGMMRGLRLGSPDQDIDYRERSPLVVPPSRALPAPQAPGTGKAANWPVDPDLKRKQEAAERRKRGEGRFDYDTFTATETPAQLNAPGPGAPKPVTPGSGRDMEAAVPPSELGSPGLFGLFKSKDPAPPVFTAEKPRKSLTEPPPGYQTPSAQQPYQAPPSNPWGTPKKTEDIPVGDVGL